MRMCPAGAQSAFEKLGGINKEVPQVCKVIERIEDDVKSTEAVTSSM